MVWTDIIVHSQKNSKWRLPKHRWQPPFTQKCSAGETVGAAAAPARGAGGGIAVQAAHRVATVQRVLQALQLLHRLIGDS